MFLVCMLVSNAQPLGKGSIGWEAELFAQVFDTCKFRVSRNYMGDFTAAEINEIEGTPATSVSIAFSR